MHITDTCAFLLSPPMRLPQRLDEVLLPIGVVGEGPDQRLVLLLVRMRLGRGGAVLSYE